MKEKGDVILFYRNFGIISGTGSFRILYDMDNLLLEKNQIREIMRLSAQTNGFNLDFYMFSLFQAERGRSAYYTILINLSLEKNQINENNVPIIANEWFYI